MMHSVPRIRLSPVMMKQKDSVTMWRLNRRTHGSMKKETLTMMRSMKRASSKTEL